MEKVGATMNVIWMAWQTQDAPCNCAQGLWQRYFKAGCHQLLLHWKIPQRHLLSQTSHVASVSFTVIFISSHWSGKAAYGWSNKSSFKFIHIHPSCHLLHLVLRLLGIILAIPFTTILDWFLLHWKIPQHHLPYQTSHVATVSFTVIFISSQWSGKVAYGWSNKISFKFIHIHPTCCLFHLVLRIYKHNFGYPIYNNHRLISLTLKDPPTSLPLSNFSRCDHVGYGDFYFKFSREEHWLQPLEWQSCMWMVIQNFIQVYTYSPNMFLNSFGFLKTFRDNFGYPIYNNHKLISITSKDPSTSSLSSFSHYDHFNYGDFYFKFSREEHWLQPLEWQSHMWMIIQNFIQFFTYSLDMLSISFGFFRLLGVLMAISFTTIIVLIVEYFIFYV